MIGSDLRARRKARKWSKETLSALAGVSRSTVNRAEDGFYIRPSMLAKIEAALVGPDPEQKPRKPRGFAAIDKERQRKIASQGGKTQSSRRHRWTPEEARAAGSKGGTAIAQNREHMAEIGRRGWITYRSRK